jgi:hypothetical protein
LKFYIIHSKKLAGKREGKGLKSTVLTLKIECTKAKLGCYNSKSTQLS